MPFRNSIHRSKFSNIENCRQDRFPLIVAINLFIRAEFHVVMPQFAADDLFIESPLKRLNETKKERLLDSYFHDPGILSFFRLQTIGCY